MPASASEVLLSASYAWANNTHSSACAHTVAQRSQRRQAHDGGMTTSSEPLTLVRSRVYPCVVACARAHTP